MANDFKVKNGLISTCDAKINSITVGRGSGNILCNTANGYQALYSNTTGYNNTAIGRAALFNNTTGSNNIGLGCNSGCLITTGVGNVIIGSNTGSNGLTCCIILSDGAGNNRFNITCDGTVCIPATVSSTNTTTGALIVAGGVGIAGALNATTKSFDIVHPTDSTKRLRYGSLESPYYGIRLTGRDKVINGISIVQLPNYIKDLVHSQDVNVQLTNINHTTTLFVKSVDLDNDKFTVGSDSTVDIQEYEFYWTFTAERKDVDKLEVEYYGNPI